MERQVSRAPPGRPASAKHAPARRPPPMMSPAGLQARFGNQGAAALLAGMSGGGARCCGSRSLQAKLTVGPAHDRFEREADLVADRVMRMDGAQAAGSGQVGHQSADAAVQRLCHKCADDPREEPVRLQAEGSGSAQPLDPHTAGTIQAMRGGGRSLPAGERAFFEPRFGRDFGNVRIHAGAAAARAAGAIGARAFTIGSDVAFGAGQYRPGSRDGRRLLAHELTHVVQQGAAVSKTDGIIQRAGDPAAIPPGFACPTDLTPGAPAGTDLRFTLSNAAVTAAHTAQLTAFRTSWLASGGADNITVHGYASRDGNQGTNWTLSCNRAQAVEAELIRLGIPAVRINIVAHGASNDFGASAAVNRHVIVASSAPPLIGVPLVGGTLTPSDDFVGRSTTRFGVGEIIKLNFLSFPSRPAADFGGLQWQHVAGGGVLAGPPNVVGTGTYTAPAAADTVRLELRVASGATAGQLISSHTISIVQPSGIRFVEEPGSAPNTSPGGGTIPAGTFGAGFRADVFISPNNVSFMFAQFGEGTVMSVVTPPGSFFGAPRQHNLNNFPSGLGGNAATGTPVTTATIKDNIATAFAPSGSLLGHPTCGASDFVWVIPWEFQVAPGPRTRFATATHHQTSSLFCDARIEKAGLGPFCRRINGTRC